MLTLIDTPKGQGPSLLGVAPFQEHRQELRTESTSHFQVKAVCLLDILRLPEDSMESHKSVTIKMKARPNLGMILLQ